MRRGEWGSGRMGKLVVIEGLDGSGKATQTRLLCEHLERRGADFRKINFPDYDHPSSALVKLYLEGQMGGLEEINAFAASSFFSVDRYASYRMFWGQDYQNGRLIVADRYTTSNASHQTSKLPRKQWDAYLDWLEDFEYNRLGLPRPDCVILLDMHPQTSRTLLLERYHGDASKRDIHEADYDYLLACRESALYTAARMGWQVIRCCDGSNPFPIQQIAAQVASAVDKILE